MWLIPAVLCLFFSCFMSIWNQHQQVSALALNFWRALVIAGMFAVSLPFVSLPHGTGFYSGALIAGLASFVTSTTLFYAAKEKSAHMASLFMPLAMIVTYMAWWGIDESRFQEMAEAPVKAGGVLLAMLIANICLFTMRKIRFTHISFLRLVLFNAALMALSQIWVKEVMGRDLGAVLYLSFIIFVLQAALSFISLKVKALSVGVVAFDKNFFVLCIVSAVSCICSWYAVILAPDPSYLLAVLLFAPFLLAIYHRYYKHDITDSLMPGSVVAACSLIIVVLSF